MGPKVLLWDVETAPLSADVWKLWDNNVGLNQIGKDWYILSWAAKWLGETQVFYEDQSESRNVEDDKKILKGIWKLLDSADIVVTHNGIRFDKKKINARFILNGMQPPSSYREIDTLTIVKKHFAFTSNKLEYLTNKLCKIKKLSHKKFPGHTLWSECIKGNPSAWAEMRRYNIQDTKCLQELLYFLLPWQPFNFNLYSDDLSNTCSCGNRPHKKGFYWTETGKYQRYRCHKCGAESRGSKNLLSKGKLKSLLRRTSR